jgi:hypothetical protein
MSKRIYLLASAIILAICIAPFALAASGTNGRTLRGGARSPSDNPRQVFTKETEIIANTSTYGTRQSNKSTNGGGAIYGCRSGEGGSAKGNEPCVRAINLEKGRAFEFVSDGAEVGRIESSNSKAAPFTTNATGVATGLNADQVDGKSASDIVTDATTAANTAAQALNQFAIVDATGKLVSGRGAASATRVSDGNYQVKLTADVSKCAYTATETTIVDAGAVGVQPVDATTLNVRTRKGGGTDGTGPSDPADRPFHLLVTC